MANLTTPGVYVQEIPLLPASVAGVNTAIPAFIGYVEKADNNGTPVQLNTPVRITSLLEYESIFGKGETENITISINDTTNVDPVQREITVSKSGVSDFRTYYNVQLYFANGGGPCYIVPIGFYFTSGAPITADFMKGLDAIAKVDEPTLLLMPDAESLSLGANIKAVYDAALAQCAKLKDRFVIMDIPCTNDIDTDRDNFRDNLVGPDNLKYGSAYYPDLKTILNFTVNPNLTAINVYTQNTNAVPHAAEVILFNRDVNNALEVAKAALAVAKMAAVSLTLADATFAATLTGVAKSKANDAETSGGAITAPYDGYFGNADTAATAANAQATTAETAAGAFAAPGGQTASNAADLITELETLVNNATTTLNETNLALKNPNVTVVAGSLAFLQLDNPALYTAIMSKINAYTVTLNPSGAMAGIYARVDAERGVWKAPANVGVRSVIGPSMNMTNAEQGQLNVDATSGKSINALRAFTGRGTLVWGARTLAGNDNEWRYINVRRLFNYVEESVAEATAFVVFEPNTANTWQRVSGMIESFLTGLWRDGALAGSVPKDAFYVRVGLGSTMTAQDILEGRMIVEIGMAAVRPAEFIVLKFMHKLQES